MSDMSIRLVPMSSTIALDHCGQPVPRQVLDQVAVGFKNNQSCVLVPLVHVSSQIDRQHEIQEARVVGFVEHKLRIAFKPRLVNWSIPI